MDQLINVASGYTIFFTPLSWLFMLIKSLYDRKTRQLQWPVAPKLVEFDVPTGMTAAECREYLHSLGIETAMHSTINGVDGDGIYLSLLVPGRQHDFATVAINALQQGRPFKGKGNVSSGNPEMAMFRGVGRIAGAKPKHKKPGWGRRAMRWLED